MIVQPTLKQTVPPSLEAILQSHKREVLKAVNCARVGVIKAFDPTKQTATVMIAQQQVTSISPEGVRTIQEYPLLLVVPVVFPAGGGFTLTFPIAEGDECLVIFNDREIDNWLTTGPGSTPTTSRVHDLSDGMALVGLRSNPRALAGVSTTTVQLRSDDFTGVTGTGEVVEVGSGKIRLIADEVVVLARHKLNLNADGCGIQYLPNAVNTFTDGVTGSHSAPTPPEIAE
ncbi:MAG: phage baseplate protein [Acidobacteriia bacterium]|nr:phage baseplate protein [Terriglobia bacterium]